MSYGLTHNYCTIRETTSQKVTENIGGMSIFEIIPIQKALLYAYLSYGH